MLKFLPAALCIAVLFLPAPASADGLEARVLRIESGDTLTVQDAGHRQLRVKLAGVAAPRLAQAHGSRAQANLGALLSGQDVRLHTQGQDREGAWVARVMVAPPGSPCRQQPACPKTLDAGLQQISDGMAWWHQPSGLAVATAGYEQAEFAAKIHRRGLWADTNPQPPWR